MRTDHVRLVALATLLAALTIPTSALKTERRQLPLPGKTYDYVVIGAGTAGATLAARLAEDPLVTVAVVEAGDGTSEFNPLTFIPGADVLGVGASPLDAQPNNDWVPITEPQAGAANRQLHYARGKGIGGSSLKNFMIYQRPTSDSFISWIKATTSFGQSSPGWSWRDVYPYFTKSVTITPANDAARGAQYHPRYNPVAFPETDPTKAPLTLGYSTYAFEYGATLTAAYEELGYPAASDFSSGTLNGYDYNPATINPADGHRASSQRFINNAKSRTNLDVITNALVKKINFDSQLNAVSVTYTTAAGLVQTTIGATREIVLSAGAFQSPQLLMVSGIGPTDQLSAFGIKQLVNLPGVGQGMQDHVFFSPAYEIDNTIYNFGSESQALNLLLASGGAVFSNSGSLTNPVADNLNWGRFNQSFFDAHPEANDLNNPNKIPPLWPHYEFLAAAGLVKDFQNLLIENIVPASLIPPRLFYSLLGAIVAPLSRGNVTLKSADASVYPAINPNWLSHPGDQAVAVEIYKKIRRIFNTKAFKAVRANNQEYYPGYDVQSDSDILAVIQESVQTVWHAACTCAMGPRSAGGVLDPYLRVYGVKRLRVVDASSFPTLPPGHPQSTVYMLAERAADLIKSARTGRNPSPPNVLIPTGDPGTPYTGN